MVVAIPSRNRSREHVAVGIVASMDFSGHQEEFVISENESCSYVIRPDWPTRENDGMCSTQAAVICSNSECEALLCILHGQRCDECQQVFCDGCTSWPG
jgi:hypothetical protein